MGHFGKGPRYGGGDRGGDRGGQGGFGGKKFGGKPSFGGRSTTMHPAVCGTCGKDCEVPFRPTGNRPIFCKECFQKQGGKSASGPRERAFERPRYEERRKPDFRADRPEISTAVKDKAIEHLKTQLSELNSKVDRVVTMLQSLLQTAPVVEEVKDVAEELVETPKKPVKKTKAKKKK